VGAARQIGLTGTKFGCGMALCGSCTVHLDGEPVRSCSTAGVGRAALAEDRPPSKACRPTATHPVQKAWAAHDVPQCGYCQSGQIMSAAALLKAKPKPTDADIDEAMTGNICRCGTYNRVRAAIKVVAAGGDPKTAALDIVHVTRSV
jgi:isoquinoline 1-oxidoreductase alpha subunit